MTDLRTALAAFVAIKPLGYGAVGTRDVDMAAWNEAWEAARSALTAQQPVGGEVYVVYACHNHEGGSPIKAYQDEAAANAACAACTKHLSEQPESPYSVEKTEENDAAWDKFFAEETAWKALHPLNAGDFYPGSYCVGTLEVVATPSPVLAQGEAVAWERERFERFMLDSRNDKGVKGREKLLVRMDGGDYVENHTQRHWWTWQTALKMTRHSQAHPPLRGEKGET
jgi:hypothetical protein